MRIARRAGGRVRSHLPAALMLIALAADVGALVLIGLMTGSDDSLPVDVFRFFIVTGAAYAIVGWLIASRRPGNAIGWIFLVIGLSLAGVVFAFGYSRYGLAFAPGSLPLADLLSWVGIWAWAPGFTLVVTLSVLLFPNGRPPTPRWRPSVWASLVAMGLLTIPVAIVTWPHRGTDLLAGTDALSGAGIEVALGMQSLGSMLAAFVALASIAGMVIRYRRGGPTERQQLKWFTYASVPEIAFIVSAGFDLVTFAPIVVLVASFVIGPLLPTAAAIAILRYHLFEIDRIVSRTISYGLMTALLVAVFLLVNLELQWLLSSVTSGNSLAVAGSTLLAAALFTPVRQRVQRIVDRRFDRARYDGERTASAFSVRMRDAIDLPALTQDLDVTVRGAIAPSSLGVWLRGDGR